MTEPAAGVRSLSAVPDRQAAHPPADLDRRFYAYAIDRALAWSLFALAGYLGYRLFFADDRLWAGFSLLAVAVLLVGLGFAVPLGLAGTSPGKTALGLRVVRVETGTPIGLGPALLRTLVLGAAALPTFGLGVATLAQTAVLDPGRQRRGWHDRLADSIVLDVRRIAERVAEQVAGVPEPESREVVNLTTMRLAPSAVPEPAPGLVPPRHRRPTPTTEAAQPRDPDAPPADWRVTVDTGETFLVEGLGLVGRRPVGRPGEPVRHLVPVRSEDQSVSKTHLQLQLAPDGVLVVSDRGSTNGSMLIRSGAALQLTPGRPTPLLSGDLVRFGDRSMTVLRET